MSQTSFFRPKRKHGRPPQQAFAFNCDDPSNEYCRGEYTDYQPTLRRVTRNDVQRFLRGLPECRRKQLDRLVILYLSCHHRYFDYKHGSWYYGYGTRVVCQDLLSHGLDVNEVEVEPMEFEIESWD